MSVYKSCCRPASPRSAIVLLIVLGMLSLFSVLVVTYVVFTSQMRQTAFGTSVRRSQALDVQPIEDSVIRQIITGGGPRSAAFRQDLLGDLYGTDRVNARVAHRRFNAGPSGGDINGRAMLLQPIVSLVPQTTLFKFPLHLVDWNNNGTTTGASALLTQQLSNEVVTPLMAVDFADTGSAGYPNGFKDRLVERGLPDYRLSDVFTGRLLTFAQGPLAGNTFRIVRYFGTTSMTSSVEDIALAGCVVIDLTESKSKRVLFDGTEWDLLALADRNPNALTYDAGADDVPGFAANSTDQMGEPFSDDFGFRVLINGVPFNGLGQNANGAVQLTRTNPANAAQPFTIDPQFGPELLPNRRMTGIVTEAGQADEPYDAADFDNWFLAWQPADHRSILPSVATAAGLPATAAPNVIPSYHRPEVINYLMNMPILYNGTGRTFAQLDVTTDSDDAVRLQILARRIRAATFRPLNFEHLFVTQSENTTLPTADPRRKLFSDLDGDGNPFDGTPEFSGSNSTPTLNEPIAVNGTISFIALKNRMRELAIWLCNGPWDIDNDGDGIPDSVWVDFDLSTQVVGNGTVVRPMVATLIEDLDGKINLNAAGNYAQITSDRLPSNSLTSFANDADYFSMAFSLRSFGRGGGLGPSEINFSHLFDERYFGYPVASNVAPLFVNPITNPFSSVLSTRYGNLFQSRYGGNPWDYNSLPLDITYFPVAHPGDNTGNASFPFFSDPFSRMLLPSRRDLHTFNSPLGRPVDMYGRSTIRKTIGGNATMDAVGAVAPNATPILPSAVMAEVVNQPYEFEIDEPVGDDRPFTASEYASLINSGSATALSQRLTGLIGDAVHSNEALSRLLTFESRSLDGVELPGGQSVVQYLVDRLPDSIRMNPASVNIQIQRMLGVELRKGSKLNLNRPLANGRNDAAGINGFTDETAETQQSNSDVFAVEPAFPWINLDNVSGNSTGSTLLNQSTVQADYLPIDVNATNIELPSLNGGELLARNIYCLMFRLIIDPAVDTTDINAELVPNFPYPARILAGPIDVPFRNRFVAKRLAQWSANIVDMRDTGPAMTRLRYDPNPFDANGFDLAQAAANVVWGMERPEIELTESLAFHNRNVKRNLATPIDPMNPGRTADGQLANDEPPGPVMVGDPAPDQEMDQFRIPEASAYVEIRSLRDPYVPGGTLESYPAELYDLSGPEPLLDLGRLAGIGTAVSPVWRIAVGYSSLNAGDTEGYRRSVLWVNDAERMASLPAGVPSPFGRYTINAADFATGASSELWPSKISTAGDITHPIGNNAIVSLYDDDLNPTNAGPSNVPLNRFVWFTSTPPSDPMFGGIVGTAASGMTLKNVFFQAGALGSAVNSRIPGGGYAVVIPREATILGLTEQSISGSNWPYYPSNQRFELLPSMPAGEFSLRYFDLDNRRATPDYSVDSAASYRVRNVVPIVAISLPPHQAESTNTAFNSQWQEHYGVMVTGPPIGIPMVAAAAGERAGVGFNISAPLSGATYYDAPTQRINDSSAVPNVPYPKVDGYRNYNSPAGLHPDVPFDERAGAPLRENGWLGVGTYQDVANLFLQRLADPTSTWNAVDNPYITVDTQSMDLTVFNGDADMRELIDRDGDGTPVEPVDISTPAYPAQIAFDTRRKIPDPSLDRAASQLVINTPTTNPMLLNDLSQYKRIIYAQRSPLMMQQNALRNEPEAGSAGLGFRSHFRHQLTSAWQNGTASMGPVSTLHSGFEFDTTRRRFDAAGQHYPQTLGFVNREIGEPAQAGTTFAGSTGTGVVGRYVGHPIAVSYQLPTWLDRPFQSPYELMSVPATSASRLAREFGPGTTYDPVNFRETPSGFGYLLGFEANIGNFQGTASEARDLAIPPSAAGIVDASTTVGRASLTGSQPNLERAGFEQIFDVVDIGPLSFGQRRWFDPYQTRGATSGMVRNDMFNRVVQTLHAPFNYVDRHRTPGKINLNTTPDYIRQGGGFESRFPVTNSDFQRPFTGGTAPSTPTVTAGLLSGIASQPTNHQVGTGSDPFNTAVLYGNGSVYQAITAGISSAYDLDDNAGEPVTLGQFNGHKSSTDSRFGFNFKNFVQSRRGYSTSLVNPAESWSQDKFFNVDLDYRYPSRFAGMFAPTAVATLPSTQLYLRMGTSDSHRSTLRRTHDMSLLRTNPDFDLRVMDATQRVNAQTPTMTDYTIGVETPTTSMAITMPTLVYAPNAAGINDSTPTTQVASLRMPLYSSGLFERTQADLHKDFRSLDRDPFFRFKNTAQLAGMTTHHSNVFMVRFTVGYFVVDPATGAIGEEYLDPRNGYTRPKGLYIVDRTIPVGYEPNTGFISTDQLNALDTVIFSSTN